MQTQTSMSHPFYQANTSMKIKFFILLSLIILADWLFYGKYPGVSAAIFLAALSLGITLANIGRAKPAVLVRAFFILLLAVIPLVEDFNILTAIIGVYGMIYFVIQFNNRLSGKIITNINYTWQLIAMGLPRGIMDAILSIKVKRHLNRNTKNRYSLLNWVLPIVCSVVFLFLFAEANPLISTWLANFERTVGLFLSGLSGKRIVFWVLIAIAIWPMLRSKLRKYTGSDKSSVEISEETRERLAEEYPSIPELLSLIINEHSILRSLILFNLLFGLQSVLDIAYLWNGVSLPAHLTYAEYSHRGAYPLIATALLAATFVLIALRPGSDTNRNPVIRALVYVWILQNILLVTSSILRLNLYIDVYQLTYLRVAAFIWMGLVAIGLASIILRIAFDRSNSWLIKFNFTTLRIVLYACCFINFGHIIASYNISHNDHSRLDVSHLCRIGEPALPAILKVGAELEKNDEHHYRQKVLKGCFARHLAFHQAKLSDWRSWGYRSQRLSIYLKELKNANSVEKAAP